MTRTKLNTKGLNHFNPSTYIYDKNHSLPRTPHRDNP